MPPLKWRLQVIFGRTNVYYAMKTIKWLIPSLMLTLSSCNVEKDYAGEYSGTISFWLDSSPSNIQIVNTTASIAKNSQGYFLVSNIDYANGKRFSNRWKINYDTTFLDFNYVIDPVTFEFVPHGPAKGMERIEVSASVSSSELQISKTRTYSDTLGNVEFIEYTDCVAYKQ